MRAVEPRELILIVTELLEHQVLDHVNNPEARATLMLSAGMLDNLAYRVEERQGLIDESVQALRILLTECPDSLDPDGIVSAGSPRELEDELVRMLRLVGSSAAWLSDPAVRIWLGRCGDELNGRNRAEIALLRPTRYLRSQAH